MRVVEILGPGCRSGDRTTAEFSAVADRAGVDAEINHVTDPAEILARGVLFYVRPSSTAF